jgi:hypothetical protein
VFAFLKFVSDREECASLGRKTGDHTFNIANSTVSYPYCPILCACTKQPVLDN